MGVLVQVIPSTVEVGTKYQARRVQANEAPIEYSGPLAHQGPVNGVVYHSGMKLIATCGDDARICLWNPFAGRSRNELYPVVRSDGSHTELLLDDKHIPGGAQRHNETEGTLMLPRAMTGSSRSTSLLVGTNTNSIIEISIQNGQLKRSETLARVHSGTILALAAHPTEVCKRRLLSIMRKGKVV